MSGLVAQDVYPTICGMSTQLFVRSLPNNLKDFYLATVSVEYLSNNLHDVYPSIRLMFVTKAHNSLRNVWPSWLYDVYTTICCMSTQLFVGSLPKYSQHVYLVNRGCLLSIPGNVYLSMPMSMSMSVCCISNQQSAGCVYPIVCRISTQQSARWRATYLQDICSIVENMFSPALCRIFARHLFDVCLTVRRWSTPISEDLYMTVHRKSTQLFMVYPSRSLDVCQAVHMLYCTPSNPSGDICPAIRRCPPIYIYRWCLLSYPEDI